MKKTTLSILSISIVLACGSTNAFGQTISAGKAHTAIICGNDSAAISWGANANGELGVNDTLDRWLPVRVHGPGNTGFLHNIKQIVIRENFSVALMYDSTVWAWGYNADGELGNDGTIDRVVPQQVHGPNNVGFLTGITQISAGYAHVLALKFDGTVWAWGDNTNGELGDSTTTNSLTPVQVHGLLNVGFLTSVTQIAAGQQFNVVLQAGGYALSWGLDTNGELGDSSLIDKHIPVRVHGPGNIGYLIGITSISAGGQHALALKIDSTVWSWGLNVNGELGNNTYGNISMVPQQVHGPSNIGFLMGITFIKAGDYFSGAIKADSTVWTWGFNSYGQLGVNDTTERNVPVHVHGTGNVGILQGITEIGLGDEHLICKDKNDNYWVNGWNSNGQIGDGTTTDKWTPVMVTNPCSTTLGIQPITAMNEVNIYPNPASNMITMDCGKNLVTEMRIYNTLGQQVYGSTLNGNSIQYINVASFTQGIYLVQLYTNKGLIQAKFTVQK